MSFCPNTGKEQFTTAAAAYKRVQMLSKRKKDRADDRFTRGPLKAYRCRYCGDWHCGHMSLAKRPREAA